MKKVTLSLLSLVFVAALFAAETTPAKKKTGAATPAAKKADGEGIKAEAEKIAKELTPTQKTKLMEIINKGDEAALIALPGIGATRAAAIQKARPIAQPADLVDLEGIGLSTLSGFVAHAKAGFPTAAKGEVTEGKAKAGAKKSTAKKSETKAKGSSESKPGAVKAAGGQ